MADLLGSKRVDLCTFSVTGFHTQGVKIVYHVSGKHDYHKYPYLENYNYNKDPYEMEGYALGESDRLSLEFYKDNERVFERSIQVSGVNGSINDDDINNLAIPSIIRDDFCVSFGLYYSDAGNISGLTNGHQFYGVISENQSKWMERLFNGIPTNKYKEIKLSDLILPGAHDAGMYTNQPIHYFAAFANTQKDSIKNQLAMGARIFDFRPGELTDNWALRLYNDGLSWKLKLLFGFVGLGGAEALELMFQDKKNEIRHIHGFVPGETYHSTVSQIVEFLDKNTKEVVVINAVSNGIADAIRLATKSELDNITSSVIQQQNSSLNVGNKSSLNKSVDELIKANERLIIIGNDAILGSGNGVKSENSYSDEAYQSSNSSNVKKAIEKLNNKSWDGKELIEMWLQLTATGTKGGMARIGTGNYQATSPLFATKAATDMLTYPWIMGNNIKKDNKGALVAVYNDFYDAGLTSVVIKALEERFR